MADRAARSLFFDVGWNLKVEDIMKVDKEINKLKTDGEKFIKTVGQTEKETNSATKSMVEDFEDVGQEATEAAKDTKEIGTEAEKAEKKTSLLSKAFQGIGKFSKIAFAAVGAGVVALGGLAVKSLTLGGELEQNIGGSEAVFKDFANVVQTKGAGAFETMGLAQSDYLATANKMGALFQGAGFDTAKSADLSTTAMQRAADVASIMGIDTESAMEAVAGAAKGNFTMMDNLGVSMNDTSIGAYALSKGITKATKDMTSQEKIGLAMEMFLDKTAYAAGNYAKENETLAGSLATSKAALTNFLAGSGDADSLVRSLTNTANIIAKNMTEILPRLITGFGAVIKGLTPQIPKLVGQLLPALVGGSVALISGIVSTFPDLAKEIINSIPIIIDEIARAFPALAEAGFTGEMFSGMFGSIGDAISTMLPPIMELVGVLGNTLAPIIKMVFGLFQNLIPLVIPIINMLVGVVSKVVGAFTPIISKILPVLVDLITNLAQSVLPPLMTLFETIITTIMPPLNELFTTLITQILPPIVETITAIMRVLAPVINVLIQILQIILPPLIQIIGFLANMLANVLALAFHQINNVVQMVVGCFQGLMQFITGVFTGNWSQAWNGIVKMFGSIFQGIGNLFKTPINFIISGINKFLTGLSNIKIPDWVPGVGGMSFSIPLIPMLAKGTDYFEGGPAIVGERGPELVTMPRGAKVTPNNETRDLFNKSVVGGGNTTINNYYSIEFNINAQGASGTAIDSLKDTLSVLVPEIIEEMFKKIFLKNKPATV